MDFRASLANGLRGADLAAAGREGARDRRRAERLAFHKEHGRRPAGQSEPAAPTNTIKIVHPGFPEGYAIDVRDFDPQTMSEWTPGL